MAFSLYTLLVTGYFQVKVDQYWPEELHTPVRFGEVEVELTRAGRMNGFLIRQMILSMVGAA